MRTAVRLTGRKNIPVRSVDVRLIEGQPQKVMFSIRQSFNFNGIHRSSTLKLRFFENKGFESVNLGILDDLLASNGVERALDSRFSRPSCQLRVVQSEGSEKGLLLGSTPNWTLDSDSKDHSQSQNTGILYFAVGHEDPLSWRLELRENDYPTIYVDESIPNAKAWAKGDPVFTSLVLPVVIRNILEAILQSTDPPEWMVDWRNWVHQIGIHDDPPVNEDREERIRWIEKVVVRFAQNHKIHRNLVTSLRED
ncbi:MAG: hypothetical protein F4Y47_00935 [Acidobacteriia bacterium]|nr:hypothetical protein [Terriglobia bacterium]MYK09933.1 hypothetical protein [Terriglobia bacterium]